MSRRKSFEKPKNRKGAILHLLKYLLNYKWSLIIAVFLAVASNLFALIGPLLSGYAIDAIEPGVGLVNFEKVFYYIALMIGFYLLSSILSYILKVLMIIISRKIAHSMRKDVFNKLMELPIGYFDKHQTGDILSRISYDIDTINSSLSSDLIQVASTLITVVGALIMMIAISSKLVLIFAITVPMSLLWSRYLVKKTRPLFRKRSGILGDLNSFIEEMVTGQKTIKAYVQEKHVIEKFHSKNKKAVNAYYNAEFYGGMMGPTVNLINNITLSFISVFGAILYLAGELSIGKISSFVLYSRKFSGPINEMANIMSDLQSTLAATERVFDVLEEQSEPRDDQDAVSLENLRGDVEFENVRFGYQLNQPVIHHLNFKVDSGKLIAIVGSTGAGKTTIVNLLMRFYDVDEGNIYLDNNNIKRITRESLRKSYAMVLQDSWLFYGSIYENLAYGKENTNLEEVIEAAKAARIHSFIERLPNGYETILSDEATNLSQGQKQLMTIARAMLLDAKILILDEATSNVDTRTELKIQEAMRNLMENKTCFVIAHRLSTIKNADLILVIEHGDIVEQGTHEELMETGGQYQQLYQAQFE